MSIRTLIADDQQLVRAGLSLILRPHPDIEVVGEATDGHEALALAHRLRPDVILMDIRMPRVDGLEATRCVLADPALAATRVLILTTFDLDGYVYDALRAGASGFMLKDAPPERLADAIRTVAAGDALLAPSITRRLIEGFPPPQPPSTPRLPACRSSLLASSRCSSSSPPVSPTPRSPLGSSSPRRRSRRTSPTSSRNSPSATGRRRTPTRPG